MIGTMVILAYAMFRNEIQTLISLKLLDDTKAYELNYFGSYELDAYLEEDIESWGDVLDFINENLGNGVGKYIYKKTGCSSFFARTPEGDFLLARNLDTDIAIPCVIRTDTEDGYSSLGVTNLMRGGFDENVLLTKLTVISSPYYTLDGINEYGLAIASASVPYGKDKRQFIGEKAIHDLTVNRVILDKAKSVEEALEILEKYYIVMEDKYPSHYMIGDAGGQCVIVEFNDGNMEILEMEGNYFVMTNFVINTMPENSVQLCDRYTNYNNTLKQYQDGISETQAMALLKENVIKGQAQWSVVYNLTRKTVKVSFGNELDCFIYNLDDETMD